MEQDPDNHVSGRTEHSHDRTRSLTMSKIERVSHLVKHHGWSMGMAISRGRDADYVKEWHSNAHRATPMKDDTDRTAEGF